MGAIGRHNYVGDDLTAGEATAEVAHAAATWAPVKAHAAKIGSAFNFRAQWDVPNFNAGTLTLRIRVGTAITGDIVATIVWTPVLGEDAVLEGELIFEDDGAVGESEFHSSAEAWATGENVTRTILQDRTTIDTRAPWYFIPTTQWGTGHADNDATLKSFRVWQVDAIERT